MDCQRPIFILFHLAEEQRMNTAKRKLKFQEDLNATKTENEQLKAKLEKAAKCDELQSKLFEAASSWQVSALEVDGLWSHITKLKLEKETCLMRKEDYRTQMHKWYGPMYS